MGGAVMMNAGAYGGEMKQVLKRAVVLTPEGEELSLEEQKSWSWDTGPLTL